MKKNLQTNVQIATNYMAKGILKYFLLLLCLLMGTNISAQVTIGAATAPKKYSILEVSSVSTKGGLRLPHLTTQLRDDLEAVPDFDNEKNRGDATTEPGLALGLTIYNTDTNCIEYWDGYKWTSLCLGSASIDLSNYPQVDPLPADGGETEPMVPSEKPKCDENPPYTISVTVGAAYTNAYMIEQSTGEFKVYMKANPTAKARTAIVRLTNNCTGEFMEFLYHQDGNTTLCPGLTEKPNIDASNGGHICGEMNSIILAVTNPKSTATYIWMRNDNEEAGRGNFIIASLAGNYKVYAGGIGCTGNDESAAIAVTMISTDTPPADLSIMAENGVVICGGTTVTLRVNNFSEITGTVQWYKDGILQVTTGSTITTTSAGTFMAIVDGGVCASSPSNAIIVQEKIGTAVTFSKNDVEINGISLNSQDPEFCTGGWLKMRISNTTPGYIYKWFVNSVQVGTGTTCNYQLTGEANSDIHLSVSAELDDTSTCPFTVTVHSIMSVNEPLDATITGPNIFCNNAPGGAQLSVAGGGASYVWKNLNTGLSTNTGTNNNFSAMVSGSYEAQITTTDGCVSQTPDPHEVEMVGSPSLTWAGGVLASTVGEGEKVTFVVKDVGSPVTQGYTWRFARMSGSATASVVGSDTGDTAEILFGGGGLINLTVDGKGDCGKSAPLTIEIGINENKPDAPILVSPIGGNLCGGHLFTIQEGALGIPGTLKYYEDLYGKDFTITWSETNTTATGAKVVSGANNRYCYIPFTSTTPSGSRVTMRAICSTHGTQSAASAPVTVSGGKGITQTYSLNGETCFDIKQMQYGDNACGVWEQRTRADFSKSYTYELTGTLLPTVVSDVTWSLGDPDNLVQSVNYTSLNKAIIKYNNAAGNLSIIGNKTGKSLTLYATFRVNDGSGCNATYTKSIVINIRDCDCCTPVLDMEGNTYLVARFGDAGCWMTQNLRSTKNSKVTTLSANDNLANSITELYYYYPNKNTNILTANPTYGLLYTWAAANGGLNPFETLPNSIPGTAKSTQQGICPDGWVLPSDYDWTMLEKELAANPELYSTVKAPIAWNTVWQSSTSWRPNQDVSAGWGTIMKSTTSVNNVVTKGLSNPSNKKGFNAMLVGYMHSARTVYHGQYGYYMSSSLYSNNITGVGALGREVYASYSGTLRSAFPRYYMLSVRCKKKD